jgi:hypothetical protein
MEKQEAVSVTRPFLLCASLAFQRMGIIFKLKVPSTTIGYQCLREWFRDS